MSNCVQGSSEAEEQFTSAKISVWWDIENCQVGRGVDPYTIQQNISSALKRLNYVGPFSIFAYGDTNQIPPAIQQALSITGVRLTHVPAGVKDASDKKIIVDMIVWAMDNPAPANFLLISGDRDFAYALSQLQMKRYNVILARPQKASVALEASVTSVWLWTTLMAGGESVANRVSQRLDTGGSRSNLSVSKALPTQSPNLEAVSANGLDSVQGNPKSPLNKGRRKAKQPQKFLNQSNISSSVIMPAENQGNTDGANLRDSDFCQAPPVAKYESRQVCSTSNLPVSDVLPKNTDFEPMSGKTDPKNSGAGRGSPKCPTNMGIEKDAQNGKQSNKFSSQSLPNMTSSVIVPIKDHVDAESLYQKSDFGQALSLDESESQLFDSKSTVLPTPGMDVDPLNTNTLPENSIQRRFPPSEGRETGSQRGKQSQKFPIHSNMPRLVFLKVENQENADGAKLQNSGFSQPMPQTKSESHQLDSNSSLPVSDAVVTPRADFDCMSANTNPEQGCQKTPPSQGRGTFRQNVKQPQSFSGQSNFSCSVTLPVEKQGNTNSTNSHRSNSYGTLPLTKSGSQVQQLGCSSNIRIPSINFDIKSANTLPGNVAQGYSGFPPNKGRVMDGQKGKQSQFQWLFLALENIFLALNKLRNEKIMPTEENIVNCILYGNFEFPSTDIKKALEIAVEHQLIEKNKSGTWHLYLGKNERVLKCIDPSGGNPNQFPTETWDKIQHFLTHSCGRLAILESKSRYEAATILHKFCVKGLLLGEVLHILEIIMSSKKWISYNDLECLPFTINLPEAHPEPESKCTIS